MINLDKQTEEKVQAWANARGIPADIILTQIVNWAFKHAPKNIDEFDEDGIPYMSAEEQAEIEAILAKVDPSEETYTAEEVEAMLNAK